MDLMVALRQYETLFSSPSHRDCNPHHWCFEWDSRWDSRSCRSLPPFFIISFTGDTLPTYLERPHLPVQEWRMLSNWPPFSKVHFSSATGWFFFHCPTPPLRHAVYFVHMINVATCCHMLPHGSVRRPKAQGCLLNCDPLELWLKMWRQSSHPTCIKCIPTAAHNGI